MTINNLKTSIDTRTAAIKASEATTKLELGAISRELLLYVPDSKDIGAVNRLIEVLTPKNKEMAVLFFKAFLPWNYDDVANMFTVMLTGDAKRQKKFAAALAFTAKEENNIWTWAKVNIAPMERAKNYAGKIGSTIKHALDDEKDGLTEKEVFAAILTAMPFETIFALVGDAIAAIKAEQEAKEAAANVIDGEIVPSNDDAPAIEAADVA